MSRSSGNRNIVLCRWDKGNGDCTAYVVINREKEIVACWSHDFQRDLINHPKLKELYEEEKQNNG